MSVSKMGNPQSQFPIYKFDKVKIHTYGELKKAVVDKYGGDIELLPVFAFGVAYAVYKDFGKETEQKVCEVESCYP